MPCGSVLGRFSVSCKNFVASLSKSYGNSIEVLSKFYRNSVDILSKFYRNNGCGEKLGHEAISWAMWWVCWRPWSVRARPKCKSKRKTRGFLSVPWVATLNGNPPGIRRGSVSDPSGSTFSGSNAPRNRPYQEISNGTKQHSTAQGHGTRDHDRI